MSLNMWLILAEGKPPEFGYDDLVVERLPVPTPQNFLELLFLEICNVKIEPCVETKRTISSYPQEFDGYCGTQEIGWYWHQIYYPQDGPDKLFEVLRSNHLPDTDFIWRFGWRNLGQYGSVGYRHGILKLKFGTEDSKSKFEKVWFQYFGVIPQFRAETDDERRREEQIAKFEGPDV